MSTCIATSRTWLVLGTGFTPNQNHPLWHVSKLPNTVTLDLSMSNTADKAVPHSLVSNDNGDAAGLTAYITKKAPLTRSIAKRLITKRSLFLVKTRAARRVSIACEARSLSYAGAGVNSFFHTA